MDSRKDERAHSLSYFIWNASKVASICKLKKEVFNDKLSKRDKEGIEDWRKEDERKDEWDDKNSGSCCEVIENSFPLDCNSKS